MQAGGGLLYQGLNSGSYLNLTESTVINNYVDSSFTGSTSSGLGGELAFTHLNMPAGGASSWLHDKTLPGLFSCRV